MYFSEFDSFYPLRSSRMLAGDLFLRGYADAYHAHQLVSPDGPAGEEYKRGYNAGLQAVQRDFFAAMSLGYEFRTSLADARGARWPLSVASAPVSV